jgi:ABC-type glycerol-3-phosphate transport system permease component
MNRLSNGVDIELNGVVYLWPRVFSLESYGLVLKNPAFLIGTRNTVLRTLLGVPLSVMVTAMYAFADHSPGKTLCERQQSHPAEPEHLCSG